VIDSLEEALTLKLKEIKNLEEQNASLTELLGNSKAELAEAKSKLDDFQFQKELLDATVDNQDK